MSEMVPITLTSQLSAPKWGMGHTCCSLELSHHRIGTTHHWSGTRWMASHHRSNKPEQLIACCHHLGHWNTKILLLRALYWNWLWDSVPQDLDHPQHHRKGHLPFSSSSLLMRLSSAAALPMLSCLASDLGDMAAASAASAATAQQSANHSLRRLTRDDIKKGTSTAV